MKNQTYVVFFIDKSGSMESKRSDVIGGFDDFIKTNQSNREETLVSLFTFSNQLDECNFLEKNVKDVRSSIGFNPNGNTALIDSACKCIDEVGRRLASKSPGDRPDKVVFIIMTDGQENASRTYTMRDLRSRVETQTNQFGWQFVFMGANIDSFADGANYGFAMNNTTNLGNNKFGDALRSCGVKVSSYSMTKSADSLSYSAQDRSELA